MPRESKLLCGPRYPMRLWTSASGQLRRTSTGRRVTWPWLSPSWKRRWAASQWSTPWCHCWMEWWRSSVPWRGRWVTQTHDGEAAECLHGRDLSARRSCWTAALGSLVENEITVVAVSHFNNRGLTGLLLSHQSGAGLPVRPLRPTPCDSNMHVFVHWLCCWPMCKSHFYDKLVYS